MYQRLEYVLEICKSGIVMCQFIVNIYVNMYLRLQSFPRGLGKGSDAALIGAWLETVMMPLDESMVPAASWHQGCVL